MSCKIILEDSRNFQKITDKVRLSSRRCLGLDNSGEVYFLMSANVDVSRNNLRPL